jgi:two-component system, NtrC family, sensor histidine kinase HydH
MNIQKDSTLYAIWTRYKVIPLYWKVLPILFLLAAIFLLDQRWMISPFPEEIIHRLYFLPIILSGLLFGLKGGFLSALVVTFFFISHWFKGMGTYPRGAHIDELILFYAFGILIGLLVDRERMETRLREEQEHLAIIGEAAATVAHELKNPIITIGAYVKKIQQRIDPADPNRERLAVIFQECQRVEVLLKDMIHFSRPIDLELSPVDINRLVKEVLEVIHPQAEQCRVLLSSNQEGELPLIQADKSRLTQVLYNLILNAVQASDFEQPVLVQTRRQKGQILIEVSDLGCGIKANDREKIFHPFFSTKKQGSGMGLPISRRIIELHNGRLFYRPNKPSGTIFSITLPINKKGPLFRAALGGRTD